MANSDRASSVSRRVARKEIALFFASPVAWLFLSFFAAVTLFVFFWVESWFARNIADVRPLFEWMPVLLIFLAAALTMRMWSEERRSGTLEHVLTQPASPWRFVLGKFAACIALLALALVATLPLPITAALIAELDWGPVVAAYLASCLLGAMYIGAGLLISSRTDNAIVSLIGTVALCGTLYLLGSDLVVSFFDDRQAQWLRRLGSGARFESISRGVLDIRDLCYYLSLTGIFLVLNVYQLEKLRWGRASTARHRQWRLAVSLALANLLLVNVWLERASAPRIDLTEERMYSISAPTREVLSRIEEPLLIRAYFSARNHSLLAPLVPQLSDLLREYELAGKGKIRIEFVDPADDPAVEKEANERFGIRATPFQVADRHQASLVYAYFNLLVQYGSEHLSLGFTDLLEVRTATGGQAEVSLRNPEYDLTRAIRDLMQRYRSGGDLFAAIDDPVELIAYVSAEDRLPDALLAYRDSIAAQLQELVEESDGKLSVRFIEPEAAGGEVAQQIEYQWGFTPIPSEQVEGVEFFFYLTLADKAQVVQLPTDNFDPSGFRDIVEAGLKRFAPDWTRTVALALPAVNEQMARQHLGAPTFVTLERVVARDYNLRLEDLSDGSVTPEADILAVVAPHRLNGAAIYAIDQFLMRGGTLLLATSPYTVEMSGGQLQMREWESGLTDWLSHHGIGIGRSLVLDEKNALFPTPVRRIAGGQEFDDLQILQNPYLVDIRRQGKSTEHPITSRLPQLTMAWPSPVEVARNGKRRVKPLLWSSRRSWISSDLDIMPEMDENGSLSFPDQGSDRRSALLGVVVRGQFDSYFANRELPAFDYRDSGATAPASDFGGGVLKRAPESARIILFASNDFMDDQVLNASIMAAGTQYLGPLELFMNTIDWALQDGGLLQIRSRAHFNRTLPPMEEGAQAMLEYTNYALAILWLIVLAMLYHLLKAVRRRRYRRGLQL